MHDTLSPCIQNTSVYLFPIILANNNGCETPETPDYGWVDYGYITVGASCWYHCNIGYKIVGAELSMHLHIQREMGTRSSAL